LNEPGITNNHIDFEKYTKIIHYKNIEIAQLYMIQKKEDYFPKTFGIFYDVMEEEFKKNHTLILKDLEEEKKKANEKEKVITGMYSMNITLDYKQLYILYKEECTKRESVNPKKNNKIKN
jgi:hypothetical protein